MVVVHDVVLREGNQISRADPTLDELVHVAHVLADMGIKELQIGYNDAIIDDPSAQDKLLEFSRRLVRDGIDAQLEFVNGVGHGPWKQRFDDAVLAGASVINSFVSTGAGAIARTAERQGLTVAEVEDQTIRDAVEAVEYAKAKGMDYIASGFAMASTGDRDFLRKLAVEVAGVGATLITLYDSLGQGTPWSMQSLFSDIREVVPGVRLKSHCHNDFGMAAANTLGAIQGGATDVDCAVNGFAERSGHCPLEDVVMALDQLMKIETGIDTTRLCEVSKLVSEMYNIDVHPRKSVVGSDAFAAEGDVHVGALASGYIWGGFDARLAGNSTRVTIGKDTGPLTLDYLAKTLNVEIAEQDRLRVSKMIRDRVKEIRRPLSEAEFIELVTTA